MWWNRRQLRSYRCVLLDVVNEQNGGGQKDNVNGLICYHYCEQNIERHELGRFPNL
jgi:hypothetical protein